MATPTEEIWGLVGKTLELLDSLLLALDATEGSATINVDEYVVKLHDLITTIKEHGYY